MGCDHLWRPLQSFSYKKGELIHSFKTLPTGISVGSLCIILGVLSQGLWGCTQRELSPRNYGCPSDNTNPENKKLLTLLGSYTPTSTTMPKASTLLVIFIFACYYRTGNRMLSCGVWGTFTGARHSTIPFPIYKTITGKFGTKVPPVRIIPD
jgi:hypothetical protein